MSEEQTQKAMIVATKTGLQLRSLDDFWRYAKFVAASGFAPKGMEKPESVVVAMQMGAELGITPMAALQNIAVINGRPSVFGDTALALVRNSGELESFEETYVGRIGTDEFGARCVVKRKGCKAATEEFTIADAKLAKLWGKPGPWSEYPKRMLRFRARSYALRDHFGDILKGFRTVEEAHDINPQGFEHAKPVTDADPEGAEDAASMPETQLPPEPPKRTRRGRPAKPKAHEPAPPANPKAPPEESDEIPGLENPSAADSAEAKESSAADRLKLRCEESGISIGQLLEWARETGNADDSVDSLEFWHETDPDSVARTLAAFSSVKKAILENA